MYLTCDSLNFCCTWQSQVPQSTTLRHYKNDIFDLTVDLWSWPQTLILTSKQVERLQNVMVKHVLPWYDLDLWPTAFTYNPSLAAVKVNYYAKNQGHRSNDSNRRPRTDRQTHKQMDATKLIISPASRSIIFTGPLLTSIIDIWLYQSWQVSTYSSVLNCALVFRKG